jgi:hypothetical protein
MVLILLPGLLVSRDPRLGAAALAVVILAMGLGWAASRASRISGRGRSGRG